MLIIQCKSLFSTNFTVESEKVICISDDDVDDKGNSNNSSH